MDSSQHSSGSRKRKAPDHRGTVLVNEANNRIVQEGSVIVGHRVGAEVANRSGLLAGIGSTPGLASLPESISPEDIKLWEAACIVDTQPSTAELITILKVADVLADEDPGPWISNFTDRVLKTDWTKSEAADEMASHLLTLPPHLLHHIFSSCMATTSLGALYAMLPPTLHDTLISCAAAGGNITVPKTADALFFLHLSKAFILNAGLVSIELPALDTFTAAAAALLARAISAHPSLMSLDLCKTCMSPAALRALNAGLREDCLPLLSTLRVATAADRGATSALARFLKKVSSVRSAAIEVQPGDGDAASAKAGLLADVSSASDPTCLPNIEELHFFETVRPGAGRHASCGKLLAFIKAPVLSDISIQTDATYMSRAALLTSLARFTALQQLTIDADCLQPVQRQTPVGAAAAMLPALQELTVQGACCWLPLEMAHTVTAAATQSLTRLHLRKSGRKLGGCGTPGAQGERSRKHSLIRAAFQKLWGVVARCAQLRHLEVRLLCGAWAGDKAVEHSKAIADCLGNLTQLTYLALQPEHVNCGCKNSGDCMLHGGVLGPVLQRLSTLQELHLVDGGALLKVDGPQALLKGVGKVKALRVLGLGVEGLQMQKVAEVVRGLPELKLLELLHLMFKGEQEQHMNLLKADLPELEIVPCGAESASDSESGSDGGSDNESDGDAE